MFLFKIIGAVLICLGLMFRAICVAYFKAREPHVGDTPSARRGFAASKRRALYIDVAFFLAGVMILLSR